jgi:predicted ATPase/predicted Ser/Thr protein kinase
MSVSQIIGNRFRIDDPERDLLGRGGMGAVYRGTDTETGQPVAIKALQPEAIAARPDLVARFVREGQALRQLNHPNIVKMIDAIQQADQHYLVIEYVAGGSLRDLLEEKSPLPIVRALEIALDVADALGRAHRLGIVHRDLKPANVLLAEDGTPRLTDFGIAHVADKPRLTQTGELIGTIDYISPEACNGQEIDARADIWALGVLLYEMLTGTRPFSGDTIIATLSAIVNQPIPDLANFCAEMRQGIAQDCPDVPDALADLLYRMLEKDPLLRIPSVRLAGGELEAILATMRGQQSQVGHVRPSVTDRFPAPTIAASPPRHNLPVQATPFVGRETELARLGDLLTAPDVRLVTILGPGGMGKTRLALQSAEAHLDRFGGVYHVPLAPLQSAQAIVPAVADATGFSFYGEENPRQQLLGYLCEKDMLLVMDNFEHVLEGADLVTEILQVAPHVAVLATSRARLNVRGEHLFAIAGMSYPTPESVSEQSGQGHDSTVRHSAVQLFLQTARRVRSDLELESDDLEHVTHICHLVQGMPLGILLAATWIEMLTPAEIASELGQSLDFLETDLRDVPERQRSIRAVFDYSWDLLTPREQEVFQGLSVFRGGFTRQAAQQVTDASLRDLMSLVSKSLLHRTPDGRYEVHELLRQYAAEMLDASPAAESTRDRHCAHYSALLERTRSAIQGRRQQSALEEIATEIENIHAAWAWAIAQDRVEHIAQAVESLCQFYERRGRYQDGVAACRLAANQLARLSAEAKLVLSRVLAWQGHFEDLLGHAAAAAQLLEQSLALLDSADLAQLDTRRERAFALIESTQLIQDADRERAQALGEQSLSLYREIGDRWGAALALDVLGRIVRALGAHAKAQQLIEESLAIRRELGDQRGIADSLLHLGHTVMDQGQLQEAERLVREGLELQRKAGDRARLAEGLSAWGIVLMFLGQFVEARPLFEESLSISEELGYREGVALVHLWLGISKGMAGQYEQGYAHGQRALDIFEETDARWGTGYAKMVIGWTTAGMARRPPEGPSTGGQATFVRAQGLLEESIAIFREIGQRDEMSQALAYLSHVLLELGLVAEAQQCLVEALHTASEIGTLLPMMISLPAIARLLIDRGDLVRAAGLWATISSNPMVTNARWLHDMSGQYIADAIATLPPADLAARAEADAPAQDLGTIVAGLLQQLV